MSQIDQLILYRTHLATFANGVIILRNPFDLESKDDTSIVNLVLVLKRLDELPNYNDHLLLLSRDSWNLFIILCKSFKDEMYQYAQILSCEIPLNGYSLRTNGPQGSRALIAIAVMTPLLPIFTPVDPYLSSQPAFQPPSSHCILKRV